MMLSTGPDNRAQIREIIRGPVALMSNISSQGEATRLAMWKFWLDTLEAYPVDLVRRAFDDFTRSGRRYVTPPDIVQIIEDTRREAAVKLADMEARHRRDAEDDELAWRRANRVPADVAQAILEEAGFSRTASPTDMASIVGSQKRDRTTPRKD